MDIRLRDYANFLRMRLALFVFEFVSLRQSEQTKIDVPTFFACKTIEYPQTIDNYKFT